MNQHWPSQSVSLMWCSASMFSLVVIFNLWLYWTFIFGTQQRFVVKCIQNLYVLSGTSTYILPFAVWWAYIYMQYNIFSCFYSVVRDEAECKDYWCCARCKHFCCTEVRSSWSVSNSYMSEQFSWTLKLCLVLDGADVVSEPKKNSSTADLIQHTDRPNSQWCSEGYF